MNYCEMRKMSVFEYCGLLRSGEAKRDCIYLAMVEMGATSFRKVVGPGIDLIAKKQDCVVTNQMMLMSGSVRRAHRTTAL